jgi:hypothetical protein
VRSYLIASTIITVKKQAYDIKNFIFQYFKMAYALCKNSWKCYLKHSCEKQKIEIK